MAQVVKNLPAIQETWVRSLAREDPLEKGMAIHASTLPGKFHGQRSLVGYSPWGCKELSPSPFYISARQGQDETWRHGAGWGSVRSGSHSDS